MKLNIKKIKRQENNLWKEITSIDKKDKITIKNLITTKNQLFSYYLYWQEEKQKGAILLARAKLINLLIV